MSTWGVGDNHDSDEVRALKEQLRIKDAANATLHGEQFKRELEMKDIQNQLTEAVAKLRHEADRILQLEADLKRRTDDLSNEQLTRANVEVALTTAEKRLKESEQQTLELQSTLDTLSNQANSTSQGRMKLEQENSALQTRLRAMERELQSKTHVEDVSSRQGPGPSGIPRHRRQPSESYSRAPALEKELAELRATSSKQALELQRASEQLSKARDEVVQLQNEKTASERRLQRQLLEAQDALDDREEEVRLLRGTGNVDDAAVRESDLLERLEMEEKRVEMLENELARSAGSRKRDLAMLQDELDRTTRRLDEANRNVAEAESKISQLAKDREEAMHDREQLLQERDRIASHLESAELRIRELQQQPISGGASLQVAYDEAVAEIERLTYSAQRLRGERDQLRCDIEFLNAENRFARQSLEEKLLVATSVPPTPAVSDGTTVILQGYVQAFHENAERSARAAVALALVAQYAEQHNEDQAARIQTLSSDLATASEQLHHSEHALQERQDVVTSLEQQLLETTNAIGNTGSQVASLMATIQRLEDELAAERSSHVDTGVALSDTEAQLNALTDTLADAEAARDALALEKTNLESDLDTARQELVDAAVQHSEQLASLSAAQCSGQGNQAALRALIRDLEDRVQRRTEQIGIHQRDIKRLEANMKLQEERISELTQELEVVQNEKIAMLEDCRTTREERDDAMRRCDELDEAMEGVEEARQQEVDGMVRVSFDALAAKRDMVVRMWQMAVAAEADQAMLEGRVQMVEAEKAVLSAQAASLASERDHIAQTVEARLSSTQSQLEESSSRAQAAEEAKAAAEAQLHALRAELEAHSIKLVSLQSQLAAAHASHDDRQSLEASLFAEQKAALELQLQQALVSRSELEGGHQSMVEELKRVEGELQRAEDELATHLANSAAHSETGEQLRLEIEQIRQQHADEAAALQEQLKSTQDELVRLQGESDASLKVAEEQLADTMRQLETRLAEASESLATVSRLEAELEQVKAAHAEETRTLRAELDTLTTEIQDITRRKDELETLHEQTLRDSESHAAETSDTQQKVLALETQLAELRTSHSQEVSDLQARLQDAGMELQDAKLSAEALQRDAVDELTRTIEGLEKRVAVLAREADEARAELDEEKSTHARIRESTTSELRETIEMRDEAETALAKAESELSALRAQLDHAEASLRETQEANNDFQCQITELEAEIQRVMSLERYHESQVAESERRASSLESELQDLRTRCTALDKLAQTTEANLHMQTIQHEQTVASLRRELNALRSQPTFEEEIVELKEKNAEYEEALRAKCLEIEENDDKFFDMLKEKKKLNSKVDSLTRKVHNLQTKLAAATEALNRPPTQATVASPVMAMPTPIAIPALPAAPKPPTVFSPSGLAPAAIITTSSASSSRTISRQRVVTAPMMQLDSAPVHSPAMPAFRPKTPDSSRRRMMSGPSSITRPKTPEIRVPAMPVFKARTPERHRVATTSSLPESGSSGSLIGVKRRAPDDFDDCAELPPQTFSADSAPLGYAADGPLPAQPTTPRLRKALQTMRTGFTPIRHTTRAGSTSPRRATTGATLGAAPLSTILDVTNSPRSSARHEPVAAAKPAMKKSWLGKIKGGKEAAQSRGFSSRPPAFDPPSMRHP